MGSNQKKHNLNIVVFEYGSRQNGVSKSFVVPGELKVSSGEEVTWMANTTDVVLFFPDDRLFGTREEQIKQGGKLTLTVGDNLPSGEYPYAVFTSKTNDFAEGGSSPVMII